MANAMSAPAITRRLRITAAAGLLAAASSSFVAPAKATIIWEGKVVEAWPDLPQVPVAVQEGGAQLAVSTPLFPHPSGVVNGLTIIVDFSDQPADYSKTDVDAWLNEKGFAGFSLKGSIRDYFLGQSRGKVDYRNEVHGFYRAKQPKSYYEDPNASGRAQELLQDAVNALDGEIDYSKFDNDGDGKTEAISLLYAGGEGTFAKGLWPHAGGTSMDRDGVRLSRYMMTAMNSKPTNYVFAHESGHMLFGWPDLYGVGDYCIMANRGSNTNPVGINDMFRADQGWVDVIDIDASTNARLSTTPDGAVYRFTNAARPSEQFVWSNLQNKQEWASIAGSGLLVWHFDKAIRGNNPPETLQLAVVQAGGNRKLAATIWPSPGSAATDLFTQGGKSEVGPNTQPNTRWNDASASGLRIYDISAPGPTMMFSVGTGALPPGGGIGGIGGVGGIGGGGAGNGGSAGSSGSGGTNGAPGGGGPGASSGLAGSSAAGVPIGGAGGAGAVGGAPPTAGAATAGSSVDGNAPSASEDGGCSCRIGARGQSRQAALASLLMAAWLLFNRRGHRREGHGGARSSRMNRC